MTLKEAIRQTRMETERNTLQIVSVNGTDSWSPQRSYPAFNSSGLIQEESPFSTHFIQPRPVWRIQEAAQTQSKVLTSQILKSFTVAGITVSPANTSAALVSVPDLVLAVNVPNCQVQLSWNVSCSESPAAANVTSFSLFRDGVKIGATLTGNSTANGAIFTVSQTIIDGPLSGLHSYAVYWAVSGGTVTADGKNRNLTALLLKPQ